MSDRLPARAVVTLAALDLRRAPAHDREMLSQLLLGEVVRVLGASRDRQWWRVENLTDGDRGWARAWGLLGVSAARAARWTRRARARAALPFAEVREKPGAGPLVAPLFWGARVIAGARRGTFRRVELPSGRRGWVQARALAGRRVPRLAERIRGLLGIPYLWGGRTALGMDCSALTQLLLLERGRALPRDAHEQFRRARPLGRGGEPREGDLVFFGRPGERVGHVGVSLGAGYFAHSRGEVRIGSLVLGNPLYDRRLAAQFKGFRRIENAFPSGPSRPPIGQNALDKGGRDS